MISRYYFGNIFGVDASFAIASHSNFSNFRVWAENPSMNEDQTYAMRQQAVKDPSWTCEHRLTNSLMPTKAKLWKSISNMDTIQYHIAEKHLH